MSEEKKDLERIHEELSFENELIAIIDRFKEKLLSDAIRFTITELLAGTYGRKATRFFDSPEILLENLTKGIDRITPAQMMKVFKERIVYKPEKENHKSRLEIIFKHLSSSYEGKRDLSITEINTKIEEIRKGLKFPKPDLSNKQSGEGDGKYKAISNFLRGEKNSKGELIVINNYTIRFAIALLGIKLGPLEELLVELQKEEKNQQYISTSTQPAAPLEPTIESEPRKELPTKWERPLIIGLVVLLVLCASYFFLRNQTPAEPVPLPDVFSHKLFKIKVEMSEEVVAKDCVTITPYFYDFQDIVVNEDTLPLNKLLVKFRVANFSNQAYFPDAIYLKKTQSNSLHGEIVMRNRTIIDSTSLVFNVFEKEKIISHSIQTTSLFPSIAAKSFASGSIMLTFDPEQPPRIHEFKMGLSVSGGSISNIESSESFRVGTSK